MPKLESLTFVNITHEDKTELQHLRSLFSQAVVEPQCCFMPIHYLPDSPKPSAGVEILKFGDKYTFAITKPGEKDPLPIKEAAEFLGISSDSPILGVTVDKCRFGPFDELKAKKFFELLLSICDTRGKQQILEHSIDPRSAPKCPQPDLWNQTFHRPTIN